MKITVFQNENQIFEETLDTSKEYFIGRSPQCDIVIRHPEISRRHAKIVYVGGTWECELLSQNGGLSLSGQAVEKVSLAHGSVFGIMDFVFKCEASTEGAEDTSRTMVLQNNTEVINNPDDGTNEKTNVSPLPSKFALFKMDESGDAFEEIALGDGMIEAGRSDECQILLTDPKASRRHFSIKKDDFGYQLKDLESTHGVLVNGLKITEHQLASGDQILIGKEKFLFQEIHPAFGDLQAPSSHDVAMFDPSHQQVVKVDLRKQGGLKPLHLVLFVLLAYGIYANFSGAGTKPGQVAQPVANRSQEMGLDKLSPEQRKFLDDTYNLSLNLYTSGKYDLAALEISKIFQLVPQYKDARNIEALCQQALEIKKQKEEALQAQQEQDELKEKVNSMLAECENLYNSKRYSQVESCVSRITEMDPENAKGHMLVENAQSIMADQESSAQARRDSQRRLAAAQKAFDIAMKSLKDKRYPAAINEFATVNKIAFNDKTGMKQKALDGIKSAKEKMKEASDIYFKEGKSAFEAKDYKSAIIKFNKALKLYSDFPEATKLKEKASSELRTEMKNLYSESVIEENMGNIESAKKKWRTILDQDVPNDDYYDKAKSKTNKYER